ncbi:hypothetical protein P886_4179 [Alteromonadaceae bacterium 2753L.S.0a.02]|nr:hypothetical protein P886_4179 [Alteromonadaceae bacterium 2753L.S.0a.02]
MKLKDLPEVTSSHSEDLKLIEDTVSHLNVPKPFIYRRIFSARSQEVEMMRSELRKELSKKLDEAQRCLDEILSSERGKPEKQSRSFLKLINSRGLDQ